MNDSKPIESKQRWIEVVRWLAVLPTVYLASWVFGGVFAFLPSLVGIELRGPGYPEFLVDLAHLRSSLQGRLSFP